MAHVFETRTNPTPIRQTIRSSHRRISIWRGRHTLASGRNQPQKPPKTTPPPHCVLLSNVHANRKELRHLRTRAASGHQSTTELATTPLTHDAPLYARYRSCQPHILETPSESKPTRRSMVRRIQVFDIDSIFGDLDRIVASTQERYPLCMKAWQEDHEITNVSALRPPYGEISGWRKEGKLVVPPNLSLKRKIMYHVHDAPRKHPNQASTLRQTSQCYWWPNMKNWIEKYVGNCEQCHNALPSIKATIDALTSLRTKILRIQQRERDTLESWGATRSDTKDRNLWMKDEKIAIPPDEILRREILQTLHDAPTAGHPGRDETFTQVSREYWWPGMRTWITNYVAGCAICQQNKNITHRKRTPLYRIPTTEDALPFEQIALDLITGLPPNGPYDSILTVVDHGCSRAAVFLPCATTVTGPGVAQLYFDNMYRWFGLPSKVISDRDPRFTSHFGRALASKIGAKQNLSTAFPPQTDGLSERKNQGVEQSLRLVANAQQGDWSRWVTGASAVHNDHVNATLGA